MQKLRNDGDPKYRPYAPRLIESFVHEDSQRRRRRVNVLERRQQKSQQECQTCLNCSQPTHVTESLHDLPSPLPLGQSTGLTKSKMPPHGAGKCPPAVAVPRPPCYLSQSLARSALVLLFTTKRHRAADSEHPNDSRGFRAVATTCVKKSNVQSLDGFHSHKGETVASIR